MANKKKKKITTQEQLNNLGYGLQTINNVLRAYIEYKGDMLDFQGFLDKKMAEAKKIQEEKAKSKE